jgi:ABC-type amino acid transport substrate-binding protein
MIRRVLVVIAVLLAGSAAALSRPLDKVVESGILDISVYKDFAPHAFHKDGVLVGIDVEIGALLAAELGVAPRYMVRMAGETVDDDLRANIWRGDLFERKRADVMMHVPADPELAHRNDLVMVCCGYFFERMAVMVDADAVASDSLAAFRARKIAVELDTIGDFFLASAFRGQLAGSILRGRVFEDAMRTFLSGEAQGLMAPRAQLEWVAAQTNKPVRLFTPAMPGIDKPEWPVGMAVRTDSRDLGYALEEIIGKLTEDGRLQAIYAKYGVNFAAPPVN